MTSSTVEKLLKVQDHDLRIFKFEKELHDLPARKAEIEKRLSEHRDALTAAREQLKARQVDIKKTELEIESRRERIKKFREQQIQLKSNREFRTMEDEIATVEKSIRGVEDQMLEVMMGVDAAQAEVRAREKELKAEEDLVKADVQAMDRRGENIRTELRKVQDERARLVTEADPQWFEAYDRIVQKKREKALVTVENGACSGCHMKLPPYLCHAARRHTTITVCGFCGRMLC